VRSKEEILENFRVSNDAYWSKRLLLEVLCDIRDSLVVGRRARKK